MDIHDSISTVAGSGGKVLRLRLILAADRGSRCLNVDFFI